MAAGEAEPFIETLRIDAALVSEQLDQLASSGASFADRPLQQSFTDAAAAPIRGHADILDQRPHRALRTQARQQAELQATDPPARLLGDDELQIGVAFDGIEGIEVAPRQRLLQPL